MKRWILFLIISGCIFSSCIIDGNFPNYSDDYINSIGGKAINVTISGSRYWDGLINASIRLTNQKSGSVSNAVVNSSGEYAFYLIKPGNYLIEGYKPGFSFVPQYISIVQDDTTLPDMLAFPYDPNDALTKNDIYVMVNWVNKAVNIDAYMVRDYTNNNIRTDGDKIAGPGSTDPIGKVIYLYDEDLRYAGKPLVETIKIIKQSDDTYEELRYYIHMKTSNESITGGSGKSSARATVYVMKGEENLGTYPVAFGTNERVLSVVTLLKDPPGFWKVGSSGGGWISGNPNETDQIRSIRTPGYVTVEQQ